MVVCIHKLFHDRKHQPQVGLHDPITVPVRQRHQTLDELDPLTGWAFEIQ